MRRTRAAVLFSACALAACTLDRTGHGGDAGGSGRDGHIDRDGHVGMDAGPLECPGGTVDLNLDPGDGCECVIGLETCDGLDEDCDARVDEEVSRDCGVMIGICTRGIEVCEAGAWGTCSGIAASVEACDGVLDENCDGIVDEDCSCTSGDMRDCGIDTGECTIGRQRCVGGAWDDVCMGATGPTAEDCDMLDDDCDGSTDETVLSTFYRDADDDGHGDPTVTESRCSASEGFVATMDDCDDGCAACFRGASEDCDLLDNDCNGFTDEGVTSVYYLDADGDGFGGTTTMSACMPPADYTATSGDCDDTDSDVRPGGSEACNAVDDDCDGVLDDGASCPCPQANDAGSSYLFCEMSVNWSTAAMRCMANGYGLAKIESDAEQGFVWGRVNPINRDWWIGLRRGSTGAALTWEDGTPLGAFHPWATGEPSSSAGSAAVELRDANAGMWALTPQSTSNYFVCEARP